MLTTDYQISRIKVSSSRKDHKTGTKGLHVRVTPNDYRTYVFYHGKELLTVGTCEQFSLAEATALYLEEKGKLNAKACVHSAPKTFGDLNDGFMLAYKIKKADHSLLTLIMETMGAIKLRDMKPLDIQIATVACVAEDRHAKARKVAILTNKLVEYAADHDFIYFTSKVRLKKAGVAPATKRARHLSGAEEIKTFFDTLDASRRQMRIKLGLKLAILCGLRKEELATCKWVDVKWGESITIQASALKTGTEAFVVPMTTSMHQILLALYVETGSTDTLLGGLHKDTLSETTKAISKKLEIEPVKMHDLRRSFASGLQSVASGISNQFDVIETCLNHAVNDVAGIYQRHSYLIERKQLMQAWSDEIKLSA